MAVSAKRSKKPQVHVEKFESDQSDELEDESEEEPGDDMVEVKEEIEEPEDEDLVSDSRGLSDDCIEVETKDAEIKEEDDAESELTSCDDSDMKIDDVRDGDDSEDESPRSKKKDCDSGSKQKGEKHVRMEVESSDDETTETDSDEEEDDEFGEPKTKSESDTEDTKSGLADVMAQILSMKGGHNLILSKAKKDYMVVKPEETGDFQVVDADGNVKQEIKIKVEEEVNPHELARKKLLQKENLIKKFKLKPDVELDREKERSLRITATQGVVQLFTAIEKHKAQVRKERSDIKSVVAREEISSSDIKESFLDILDKEGEKLKRSRDAKRVKEEVKSEPIDLPSAAKKPKWNVFADHFYKEPTLQGWDLQSDEEA